MAIMLSAGMFDVLILVFIAGIVFYFYMTRNYNYWKKQGVKEETPRFFFGNIASCLFRKKTPVSLIKELYCKGKGEDMIGFYAFDKPYLILRDPELIKDVLIRDFDKFTNKIMTGNKQDEFGASSIFLVDNPPWKHIRHKLTPLFTSGRLKHMFLLMQEIIQDFDEHLENLKIDEKIGKPVEMKELCAKLMTDIIGNIAFGLRLNSLKNHDAEFRSNGRKMFRADYKRYLQILSIFFLPVLRPLTHGKYFDEEGTEFLKESFREIINDRFQNGIQRQDMIDLLLEIKKKQDNRKSDEYKLEGDALVSQAAIFFTGGFETTSTTTTFALYELAEHMDIQTKLRTEILEEIEKSNGNLTYEMITTLPYLNMFVHEVLRLHPIFGWVDRISDTNYTFSNKNVMIKKGTPVILPISALQRDPQYFPNPDKFNPERFSETNKGNIVPCTYFPFGEGPRNCTGARLALIQVKLCLVSFLRKYEVTFYKGTVRPLQYEPSHVFTQIKGDVFLNLRKIS